MEYVHEEELKRLIKKMDQPSPGQAISLENLTSRQFAEKFESQETTFLAGTVFG